MQLNKTELDKKIISILRPNINKWYGLGNLTARFEYKDKNEFQILKMRIHRALCILHRLDIIERRKVECYEYTWKIK